MTWLRSIFSHRHFFRNRMRMIGEDDYWFQRCDFGMNRLDGLSGLFTDQELNDYLRKLLTSIRESRETRFSKTNNLLQK